MRKLKTLLVSSVICASTFVMASCDSGGSSSSNSGISCTQIAGYKESMARMDNGQTELIQARISSDCSFSAQSESTGLSTGSFTSKVGNSYYGSGYSKKGCEGTFSVVFTDYGDDYYWKTECN